MTCTFCRRSIFLPLSEHPCCTDARGRDEDSCYGCSTLDSRFQEWERRHGDKKKRGAA